MHSFYKRIEICVYDLRKTKQKQFKVKEIKDQKINTNETAKEIKQQKR